MQEWDKLKIEQLNRKQHAHLGKKAVLILHQWLLGCRSCLNTPHLQLPVRETKGYWVDSSQGL